jgi:hypothetical protein
MQSLAHLGNKNVFVSALFSIFFSVGSTGFEAVNELLVRLTCEFQISPRGFPSMPNKAIMGDRN